MREGKYSGTYKIIHFIFTIHVLLVRRFQALLLLWLFFCVSCLKCCRCASLTLILIFKWIVYLLSFRSNRVCFVTKTPFFNWIVIEKNSQREKEWVNENETGIVKKVALAFNTVQLRLNEKKKTMPKRKIDTQAVQFSFDRTTSRRRKHDDIEEVAVTS